MIAVDNQGQDHQNDHHANNQGSSDASCFGPWMLVKRYQCQKGRYVGNQILNEHEQAAMLRARAQNRENLNGSRFDALAEEVNEVDTTNDDSHDTRMKQWKMHEKIKGKKILGNPIIRQVGVLNHRSIPGRTNRVHQPNKHMLVDLKNY